tara:strand:- start:629 stop:808 length:180 start_codon:yes stop_codon:yes gene_type:complete
VVEDAVGGLRHDNDIIEILKDFSEKAQRKQIDIKLISVRGVVKNLDSIIQFFQLRTQTF